jgi:urocanate hydratase
MGKLDKVLKSWVSKKLFVFVIATALAIFGNLTSSDWVIIATTYIGTQGVIDAVSKLKGNNNI